MIDGSERSATKSTNGESLWATAVFPSGAMRTEFRKRAELLNCIEDLPRIQLRDSARRTELYFWCIDYRRIGLRKLVEVCGGTIVSERTALARFEEGWVTTASPCPDAQGPATQYATTTGR